MSFQAPMRFSAVRQEVPVEIENEDGTVGQYILRELNGEMRDQYLSALGGRIKFNNKGVNQGLRNFDGLQADMLIRSLFERETGNPVSPELLKKWPSRIQEALFKQVKLMSGLDDEADDTAKKD